MKYDEWVKELIHGDSLREASMKTNNSPTALSQQLRRERLTPEMVIALCRAYDRSPVTGLIETGYINSWEADDVGIPFALENATNQQILDEILRRSDPESRHLFNRDGPDITSYHNEPHLTIIHNEEPEEEETQELTTEPFPDEDYEYYDYAADSSPDEDALRYELGEDPID